MLLKAIKRYLQSLFGQSVVGILAAYGIKE
jgi:hypothetical protein